MEEVRIDEGCASAIRASSLTEHALAVGALDAGAHAAATMTVASAIASAAASAPDSAVATTSTVAASTA